MAKVATKRITKPKSASKPKSRSVAPTAPSPQAEQEIETSPEISAEVLPPVEIPAVNADIQPQQEDIQPGAENEDREGSRSETPRDSGGERRNPANTLNIAKLQAMPMPELNQMAREMGIENFGTMR